MNVLPWLRLTIFLLIWRVHSGDFDWDISPIDGFPVAAFDATTNEKEVVFQYTYEGLLSDTKYFEVSIFQIDCLTQGDDSLQISNMTDEESTLTVNVNVDQGTISDSIYFSTPNATGSIAIIQFCLRVDYMLDDSVEVQSINFHETKTTVTVDLLANFTLTDVSSEYSMASVEDINADLEYPVEAYVCDNDSAEVLNAGALTKAGRLQFCVKIADDITTANVYVDDILQVMISQPGGANTISHPIIATFPDSLTNKTCDRGICNVKTLVEANFFRVNDDPIRVDGIAILSFGTVRGRRFLRTPISFRENRQLEDIKKSFDLIVPVLIDISADEANAVKNTNPLEGDVLHLVIIVVPVVVGIMCLILLLLCVCRKQEKKQPEKETKTLVASDEKEVESSDQSSLPTAERAGDEDDDDEMSSGNASEENSPLTGGRCSPKVKSSASVPEEKGVDLKKKSSASTINEGVTMTKPSTGITHHVRPTEKGTLKEHPTVKQSVHTSPNAQKSKMSEVASVKQPCKGILKLPDPKGDKTVSPTPAKHLHMLKEPKHKSP